MVRLFLIFYACSAIVFFWSEDERLLLQASWELAYSALISAYRCESWPLSSLCTGEISGGTILAFSIRSSTVGNSSSWWGQSLCGPFEHFVGPSLLTRSDDPRENGWAIEGRGVHGHWLLILDGLRHGLLLAGAHLWPSACRARTLREVGLGIGKIL